MYTNEQSSSVTAVDSSAVTEGGGALCLKFTTVSD